MKINILIICFLLSLLSCGQPKNDSLNNEEQKTRTFLNKVLSDSTNEKKDIDTERKNINDKKTAIDAVEPILYNTYGKYNIIKQRPYKVSFINNYWIIEGTLKEIEKGGTFILVLESKTGKIIFLTHGK